MFLSPHFVEAALHYSLRIYSLKSSSREAENKETIAKALVEHFESLVEQVKPVEVADKLYGIGVLEECDLKRASCSGEVLMQQVKRALWKNPGWFVDICKVLRACGVKAISQVIGMLFGIELCVDIACMCLPVTIWVC